jgi:glycerol uptake facilitator-like aquaporin
MKFSAARRVCAEFVGTAFLVTAVVGSGIMGDRLSGGNVAITLLANSIATGSALVTLIYVFGSISGAHFNPVVSVADAFSGGLSRSDILPYCLAQTVGAIAGTINAHFMFGLPTITWSRHVRTGPVQFYAEVIATFGLTAVISACARLKPHAVPLAVGTYIVGAYWFTSSTSFANPAVTVARCFTDTFAGIRPHDVAGFVLAQILGASAAFILLRWMLGESVQEMAHAREDHGHADSISRGDHVVVAD